MKKMTIAALATLMIAGALSAIGDTTSSALPHAVAFVGEGSAPFPIMLTTSSPVGNDASSNNGQF